MPEIEVRDVRIADIHFQNAQFTVQSQRTGKLVWLQRQVAIITVTPVTGNPDIKIRGIFDSLREMKSGMPPTSRHAIGTVITADDHPGNGALCRFTDRGLESSVGKRIGCLIIREP